MSDLTKRLAKGTGLSEVAISDILESAQANRATLQGCALPHDFHPIEPETGGLPRVSKCFKCEGTLDIVHAHWYQQGLEHGARYSKGG